MRKPFRRTHECDQGKWEGLRLQSLEWNWERWVRAQDVISVHHRGSRCQTDHTRHLGQWGFFLDLNCTYTSSPAYYESAGLNGDVTCLWVDWVTELSFYSYVKWQWLPDTAKKRNVLAVGTLSPMWGDTVTIVGQHAHIGAQETEEGCYTC